MIKLVNEYTLCDKLMLFDNDLFKLTAIGDIISGRKSTKYSTYFDHGKNEDYVENDDNNCSFCNVNVYDNALISGNAQVYNDCVFVS